MVQFVSTGEKSVVYETRGAFLSYHQKKSDDFFRKKRSRELDVHVSVYSRGKRFIDIIGAIVGLIITGIIFIPIAIAIKLDSPGSILFRQTRCGLNGKKFTLWKFRSMCAEAEKRKHLVENQARGYIFKNEHDPRVTRVGKFLRCTSLDEFPQFWNVLKGEMSLVGTRPPTPDEVINYDQRHFLRLKVKPGITGEWQVKGRSSVLDFEDIVDLDLEYQAKWSIWYDIKLILKTILIIFVSEGAY
jgi:lipopolysaccharide/colanic/teichoic acid biosynthesis glycosyltransferase